MVEVTKLGGNVAFGPHFFSASSSLDRAVDGGVKVTTRKPRGCFYTTYTRIGVAKFTEETVVYYISEADFPWGGRHVSVCEKGLRAAFKRIPKRIYAVR